MFGDTYGEMEDLIAAGETAINNGLRGDLIGVAAATGDNYIYGSNGYDLLVSAGGKDLIVAGAGDDLILSDFGGNIHANTTSDTYSWSFTIQKDGDSYTPVITGVSVYSGEIPGDDDVVYTGTGNDFVNAGGGDDEVYGGAGNDTLFGEAGDDFINGGEGKMLFAKLAA